MLKFLRSDIAGQTVWKMADIALYLQRSYSPVGSPALGGLG